jgi:exonuclease III
VYAPTEDAIVQEKEQFFDELQREVDMAEEKERKALLMGDLNGRVGNDYASGQGALVQHGEVVRNGNGQRIIDFCVDNRLVIGNTAFKHKQINQITFVGDGRDLQSMIDYIIITQGMRRNFRDIKVIPGAEITSDHRLLIAETLFLKTKKKEEREKI